MNQYNLYIFSARLPSSHSRLDTFQVKCKTLAFKNCVQFQANILLTDFFFFISLFSAFSFFSSNFFISFAICSNLIYLTRHHQERKNRRKLTNTNLNLIWLAAAAGMRLLWSWINHTVSYIHTFILTGLQLNV